MVYAHITMNIIDFELYYKKNSYFLRIFVEKAFPMKAEYIIIMRYIYNRIMLQ